MEELCDQLGVSIFDVCRMAENMPEQGQSYLPFEIEDILSQDLKFATFTYLLINRCGRFPEILADYQYDRKECQGYLKILEQYNILERHQGLRVRILVPRHVSWIPNGPLETQYREMIKKEFLANSFEDMDASFQFASGELSERSQKKILSKMDELLELFHELASFDSSLDRDQTKSVALIAAARPWALASFEALKK